MFDSGLFDVEVPGYVVSSSKRRIRLVPGKLRQLDLRPPPSLVAHWVAEGGGRDDIAGHDGDLRGAVTFAPGIVGQAFQFDGGNTSVVRVPWAPELNQEVSLFVVALAEAEIQRPYSSSWRPPVAPSGSAELAAATAKSWPPSSTRGRPPTPPTRRRANSWRTCGTRSARR